MNVNLKNMTQYSVHTDMIKQIAERLGPLMPRVVFLGGFATGFHITDGDLQKNNTLKLEGVP